MYDTEKDFRGKPLRDIPSTMVHKDKCLNLITRQSLWEISDRRRGVVEEGPVIASFRSGISGVRFAQCLRAERRGAYAGALSGARCIQFN